MPAVDQDQPRAGHVTKRPGEVLRRQVQPGGQHRLGGRQPHHDWWPRCRPAQRQQQIGDPPGRAAQRNRRDLADQAVQPPRHPDQHQAGEVGILADQVEHGRRPDDQQPGRGQGDSGHRIRSAREHHRLGEGLPRPDDLQNLHRTPTGSDRQLDLSGQHTEEGRARLARTEEHVTAGQPLLPGIGGNGLQERLGQRAEQRHLPQHRPEPVTARSAMLPHPTTVTSSMSSRVAGRPLMSPGRRSTDQSRRWRRPMAPACCDIRELAVVHHG